MSNPLYLVLFGLLVGVFSGTMGLGGGSIMIPIMVLALHMTQQEAHGTSLAVMIPPVTLPAVIKYYRDGHVQFSTALWIALGVALGSFFGAAIAGWMPEKSLKLLFGLVLIYVAAYTIFGSAHLHRTLILAGALVAITLLALLLTRWLDGAAVA
jgi:uncharacterized membrane protein YfcA